MIIVTVVRVQVSRDRRWRIDHRSDGYYELRLLGFLILSTRSLDQVHRRLRDEGVDPEQLRDA